MPRPRSDKPRDHYLQIRLNDEEAKKLEHICDATIMNKSEVVRCLVEGCYRKINKDL